MVAAQQVGAARAMHPGPPRALVEQRGQLGLQVVEIAGRVFVQDDGIGRQALEAPVLLRLQHLAHQRRRPRAVRRRGPAGSAGRPRRRGATVLTGPAGWRRAARAWRGPTRRRRAAREASRSNSRASSGRAPEVVEQALGMGERQREGARGGAGVVVLLGQGQRGVAIGAPRRWRRTAAPGRRAPGARAGAGCRPDRAPRRWCRSRRGRRARRAPAGSRPRPMKRSRSLSHSTAPCRPALDAQHMHRPQRVGRRRAAADGRAARCCSPSTRSRRRACRTPGGRGRRSAAPAPSRRSW